MGTTSHNAKELAEDLKGSWYFRIYALFFIVCAIVGFACLIKLGEVATASEKHWNSKIWWENASSIFYPRFHFRTEGDLQLLDVSCFFRNQVVQNSQCEPWNGNVPPPQECVAVTSDSIEIKNERREFMDAIVCNISTIGIVDVNDLIAWEMEDPQQNIAIGANSYASIWVAPTDRAQIVLTKTVAHYDKKPIALWERQLQYLTTNNQTGYYRVFININGFGVFHYESMNIYNGWQALGDIGGFAFFLLMIHTLIMIVVGICMSDTSKFLSKSDTQTLSGPSSHPIVDNQPYEKI